MLFISCKCFFCSVTVHKPFLSLHTDSLSLRMLWVMQTPLRCFISSFCLNTPLPLSPSLCCSSLEGLLSKLVLDIWRCHGSFWHSFFVFLYLVAEVLSDNRDMCFESNTNRFLSDKFERTNSRCLVLLNSFYGVSVVDNIVSLTLNRAVRFHCTVITGVGFPIVSYYQRGKEHVNLFT